MIFCHHLLRWYFKEIKSQLSKSGVRLPDDGRFYSTRSEFGQNDHWEDTPHFMKFECSRLDLKTILRRFGKHSQHIVYQISLSCNLDRVICIQIDGFVLKYIIKWDVSSRWSFGPNSALGRIETTIIRNNCIGTHVVKYHKTGHCRTTRTSKSRGALQWGTVWFTRHSKRMLFIHMYEPWAIGKADFPRSKLAYSQKWWKELF